MLYLHLFVEVIYNCTCDRLDYHDFSKSSEPSFYSRVVCSLVLIAITKSLQMLNSVVPSVRKKHEFCYPNDNYLLFYPYSIHFLFSHTWDYLTATSLKNDTI